MVRLPRAGDEEEEQCTEKHHGVADCSIFPPSLIILASRVKGGDSGRYQWMVERGSPRSARNYRYLNFCSYW